MSGHILLISYDERRLIARRCLLEQEGYRVSSAMGFAEAMGTCKGNACDLLILGHSIPRRDKEALIIAFRVTSDAPILSLWTRDEGLTDGVNYLAFTDAPPQLLANVAAILGKRSSAQAPSQALRKQGVGTFDLKFQVLQPAPCGWRATSLQLFEDVVRLIRDTGMRNGRELYQMRVENIEGKKSEYLHSRQQDKRGQKKQSDERQSFSKSYVA